MYVCVCLWGQHATAMLSGHLATSATTSLVSVNVSLESEAGLAIAAMTATSTRRGFKVHRLSRRVYLLDS